MTSSKVCFKCNQSKPLSDFYAHPEMADGRLGKCKECAKSDVSKNRTKRIDYYRAYDLERAKIPDRRDAAAEIVRAWRQEDKRRAAAHSAVARALRKGTLVRVPCGCGNPKSYAHHDDYDKKLDVIFLCQSCHKKRHAMLKSENRNP